MREAPLGAFLRFGAPEANEEPGGGRRSIPWIAPYNIQVILGVYGVCLEELSMGNWVG